MKKILPIFILTLSIYSCRKEKTQPQPEPQPAGATGTITGKVTQYDQYSTQYTVGLNTAAVSIDGTNYSTTTDANGNYTLTNVLPGTYNISFNKPGCALWQQQQVSFAGNGTYYLNGSSVEKPTYSFSNATVKDSLFLGSHRIMVNATLTPITKAGGMLVIDSKTSNLDITDPLSYDHLIIFGIPANTSTFSLFQGYGFSGTTYYKLYPYPNVPYDAARYLSVPLNKFIYSAYGNVVPTTFSITIP